MTLTLASLMALLLPATIVIAVFVLLGRQIAAIKHRSVFTPDWTADLSVERYRPMFRLLSEDDLRFLCAQPGVTTEMISRLRRQRCEVFRGYLRSLEKDFQRTSQALFLVMLGSHSDRRDLIPILIGSKAKFAFGLVSVRCRLLLYSWNIGERPVARLVKLFEDLQRELQSLSPAQGSACA